MAKTPQVKALVDEFCEPVRPRDIPPWMARLPKDQQELLHEIKRRLISGECCTPKNTIAKRIKAKLGITVHDDSICRWFRT